jgi:uncharacterized Zn-finger protein
MEQRNEEVLYVTEPEVVCDGNGAYKGHPRVFLNMGKKGSIRCPYCSLQFMLQK